jgi:hypothetical protein
MDADEVRSAKAEVRCNLCRARFSPDPARHWLTDLCANCRPVVEVCCTSADEAVRYQIPKLDRHHAQRCLDYEQTHSNRRTLITALERRLRKLAKAANSQPSTPRP